MLEKFLNTPLRDTELNLVELASKKPKVFCFQITKLSSNKYLKFSFVIFECQPTWICMAGLYFGMYWLLKKKRRFVRLSNYTYEWFLFWNVSFVDNQSELLSLLWFQVKTWLLNYCCFLLTWRSNKLSSFIRKILLER